MTKFNNNSFVITLPKKSEDPKGMLKNFLAKEIISKYPWLNVQGIDKPKTTRNMWGKRVNIDLPGIQYAGPSDAFTFGSSDHHDVSWIPAPYAKLVPKSKNFDLYSEFFDAMSALDEFAKNNKGDEDIIDGYMWGQPYRVYDDFIQIGSRIIPRDRGYFNRMTTVERTEISIIVLKIKNYLA